MTAHRDPPILLAIGLALTAIKAVLYLGTALLVGLGMAGVLSVGSVPLLAEGGPGALLGIGVAGALGVVIIGSIVLLQLLKLYVCARAWALDRTWLKVLLVLTVITVLLELPSDSTCCFFPLIIDVLLVVGAFQALGSADSAAGSAASG